MSAHSAESVLISPGVHTAPPPPPHASLLQYEAITEKKRHDCHFVPALIAD